MNSEIFLVILNSFVYIITFLIYQRKVRTIQVGSVILLLYAIVSIGSVYLFISYPIWGIWDFTNITIFPFIYLYVILLISFKPLLIFTSDKVQGMRMPKSSIMDWISVLIIIIYLGFFFQTILSSFSIGDLFNLMCYGLCLCIIGFVENAF